MGIGLIVIGTIFLLNPNINIVDFLPDFIGYILIYRGLFMLSDIDGRIENARKKAGWLIIAGLCKFGFILLIPTSSDSDVLLFTFCFAVVELLLTIPLISEFFGGMNYLCSRYDNENSLKLESEAKFFILTFTVLKNTLPLVPELFSLSDATYGYELNHDHYKQIHNIEAIKRIAILGAFAIVLICAFFMGYKFISYLKSLKDNKEFTSKLQAFYSENILTDSALWARRHQNMILTFFAAGIMFFNNVYIDTFPVIPDTIGYIFFILGSLYLSKLGINGFVPALLSVAGAAMSAASSFARMYSSGFGSYSSYYLSYYKKPFTLPIDLICAVILFITVLVVLKNIRKITSDNPDGIVFPSKILTFFMPIVALSTTFIDLLPLLENTAVAKLLPDYYALISFLIPVAVLAVTLTAAAQILKMRTNPQR